MAFELKARLSENIINPLHFIRNLNTYPDSDT
jgi:hypothetical protein